MSRLRIYLLGPPRLELDCRPVHIGRRKATALLAYLAVTGGRHGRDFLATLLWPELDQGTARARLRRILLVLRKGLGDGWLDADRETLQLNPGTDLWSDVGHFRRLLADCEGHDHSAKGGCRYCGPLLEEAAALYGKDFLSGFTLRDSAAFDHWQCFETEGLRDELARALERLARWHSAEGAYEPAIHHARRWLALDPLHEPAHRALMQLYVADGRGSAALGQYRECERVLGEGLGLPPSAETTALCEQIRAGPADRMAPVATSPAFRHNLPAQPIPLVGRQRELAEIGECLVDPNCRMLTLVGPGGSGKTRLAVEAAASRLDEFEHGVFFVSLAELDSTDNIALTIGQAIGFPFHGEGDAEERLLAYLKRRQMLLLLDNYEHLLTRTARQRVDGAGLVIRMVEAAPGVKALVTSRAALRVQDEQLYPVGGLDYPELECDGRFGGTGELPTQFSAVGLFVQSTRRVAPDFRLGPDNLPDVIRICRLVAGIPLAILLAAAWVRVLTPSEIAARLEEDLDLLQTDLRDVPDRHRSVRAVFDHSWNLLTAREKEVMAALSVFRGGFTRQAARAVVGTTLRELRPLVGVSLVKPTSDGRYQIHELLRQYAAERLAGTAAGDAARARHAAYYAAAMEQWMADFKGPRQRDALAEMDLEIDNARAAWEWAVARHDGARLLQAAGGMATFYECRGHNHEAEAVFRRAADRLRGAAGPGDAMSDTATLALVTMLQLQAAFENRLGRDGLGHALLEEGLGLLRELELTSPEARALEARIWSWLGDAEQFSGRGESRTKHERSLALFRSVDDQWEASIVLNVLGQLETGAGNFRQARDRLEESLALCRSLGDERGIANAAMWLAVVRWQEGDLGQAEHLAREAVSFWQDVGDRYMLAWALSILGGAIALAGRFAEAKCYIEQRVALLSELGLPDVAGLSFLGSVHLHQGQYESARQDLESGRRVADETGEVLLAAGGKASLGRLAVRDGAYAEARSLLRESIAEHEACGGRDDAHEARCALVYAELELGNLKQARRCLVEGLSWASERGSFGVLVKVLPAAARLLLAQGQTERAVEMYALACTFAHVANSQWFEDMVGRPIADAAQTLPPAVVAVARERGRARDVDATLVELIVEWG